MQHPTVCLIFIFTIFRAVQTVRPAQPLLTDSGVTAWKDLRSTGP